MADPLAVGDTDGDTTRIDTADVLAIDDALGRATGGAGFGITRTGFAAKPFARLLAEKLALARALLGEDLDLGSGAVIRKLLEVSALEDARTWAALGAMYDNSFIVSATGEALSRLGEEVGLPRPFLEATGRLKLKLEEALPAGVTQLTLPHGARLLTPGGHHVSLDESAVLSPANPERNVGVTAFYPGPSHNLDPQQPDQKIDRFHPLDPQVPLLVKQTPTLVSITPEGPLTGGARQWPDARYRQLLLDAPRSVWTVEAIRIAVSLVPGVRQVQVRDAWGGLDIYQSIFGNFNFIERVFSQERDLGSPYYFNVLVAPTAGAIIEGPDGLAAAVLSAIEDLRPIGIFPQIDIAHEVGIGVQAKLKVQGLPLPTGAADVVNASEAAQQLKARLLHRLRQYVERIGVGEPVRYAEILWSIMNEPGIADAVDVQLIRYPAGLAGLDFGAGLPDGAQVMGVGENVTLHTNESPVFVDSPARLVIV
jgi:hypothetical protein